MNNSSPSPTFSWRTVGILVAVTLVLRITLLVLFFNGKYGNWPQYLAHSDAASFMRMGRVLVLGAPADQLSFYDHRAFPGWPLLIGSALAIMPEKVALIGLTLLLAAAIPVLFYRLTKSYRTSLFFATVPPIWLLASSNPMAEPLFWVAALGSLLATARADWRVAGLLGGIACITKPYGIFLALGLAWAAAAGDEEPFRLRIRPLVALFLSALIPVAAVVLLNIIRFGTIAPELAVYSAPLVKLNLPPETARELGSAVGHWDWPFKALIITPLRVPTPLWKTLYVLANLVAALWLTARGTMRVRHGGARWEQACAIWLIGNTVASLCAGPYWGFHTFDRYVVWAWPAAAALNRDLLTSHRLLAIAASASFALAAFAMLHK